MADDVAPADQTAGSDEPSPGTVGDGDVAAAGEEAIGASADKTEELDQPLQRASPVDSGDVDAPVGNGVAPLDAPVDKTKVSDEPVHVTSTAGNSEIPVADNKTPVGTDSTPADKTEEPDKPFPTTVGAGKFKLDVLLGKGNFGEVWSGVDVRTNGPVAVKLEPKQQGTDAPPSTLNNEYEILHELKRPAKQQGFMDVFYFGREGDYVYLVIDYLATNLKDCLAKCGGSFQLKTGVLLAEQILRRIEYLHSRCLIHRDIKPENFMMGINSNVHVLYLIDFGLSEKYFLEGRHLLSAQDTLTGTARYSSVNAHNYAQSRRDDLEAIGYMLIFLLKGTLPWIGLQCETDEEEFKQILNLKKATTPTKLCEGLPAPIEQYVKYSKKLAYKERPEYTYMRGLFAQVRESIGPLKDHDLEFLKDSDMKPDSLSPLPAWTELEQPDDGATGFCCWGSKRRSPPK